MAMRPFLFRSVGNYVYETEKFVLYFRSVGDYGYEIDKFVLYLEGWVTMAMRQISLFCI